MSGIINSTGARSGIVGTTVGTPVTDLSTATFPAGHILQTVSSTFNGVADGVGVSIVLPHADCGVAITPSHASNKILITINAALATVGNEHTSLHIFKDGSEISGAKNSTAGNPINCATGTGYDSSSYNGHQVNNLHACSTQYLDIAGGTAEIDYDFRVRDRGDDGWFINRPDTNAETAAQNQISTITVQEIMR